MSRWRKKIYQYKKSVLIGVVVLVVVGVSGWLTWRANNPLVETTKGITVIKEGTKAPAVPAGGVVAVLLNLGNEKIDTNKILAEAKIEIVDQNQKEQIENFSLNLVAEKKGNYQLQMKPKNGEFVPGKYTVKASFNTPTGVRNIKQDFLWGVLAINPNKAVYQLGETANLALAVLDEEGEMVCDAEVELKIEDPRGAIKILGTKDGSIMVNEECKQKKKTNRPDYEANYEVGVEGVYQMNLTAKTPNGVYNIEDYFEARENELFIIERQTATRIYPVDNEYEVKIKITPRENFSGVIREIVPVKFEIKSQMGKVEDIQGKKTLVWQVNWQAGQTYDFVYSYLAPEVSPDFYLLGPMEFWANDGQQIFLEKRQWQIAVDSLTDFSDTFTEAADKTLATRVPETGGGYTALITTGSCALYVDATNDNISAADSIVGGGCGDSEGQLFRTNSAITNADYTVSVTQSNGDTVDNMNILACRIVDANNMYAVVWNEADSDLYISTTAGGWATIDTTANVGIADGSTVTLSCIGSTISVLVNGAATTLSVTNTTFASAGYAGVGMGAVAVSTQDVSAQQLDNFTVTSYATPAISSAVDTPDPTNPGRSVSFLINWSSTDTNRKVKGKVCKSATFSSQNCTDGFWASSTDFVSTNPITLTYDVVAGDYGQTRNYTIYLCSDEAYCSTGSSGTFSVNNTSVVPDVKFR
ncbi:MAG TPA: hypothetical protein PLF15_03330 [bacterium]|nr:hypothetical protein [bacterium]